MWGPRPSPASGPGGERVSSCFEAPLRGSQLACHSWAEIWAQTHSALRLLVGTEDSPSRRDKKTADPFHGDSVQDFKLVLTFKNQQDLRRLEKGELPSSGALLE